MIMMRAGECSRACHTSYALSFVVHVKLWLCVICVYAPVLALEQVAPELIAPVLHRGLRRGAEIQVPAKHTGHDAADES